MTEQIFIKVLNMSLTSSVVILAVLLGRLALRRAPRIFSYALWAVVLFRLLCPVSFSSAFSLLGVMQAAPAEQGSVSYIPEDIGYEMEPEVHLPVPPVSDSVNKVLPAGNPVGSVNPLQVWLWLGSRIWIVGLAVLLLKGIWQCRVLHRALSDRKLVSADERIYETDFSTPFVMGLFRPCIYLPIGTEEEEREYILLHEELHIRRGDHIFRFLAYLALCLHWFNPLVWLACTQSERDMEISCDEAVIRKMGDRVKAKYSASLLELSRGVYKKARMPLAFGEGEVKSRIEHVLKYKKPAAVTVCMLAVFCIAAVYLLAANPKETKLQKQVSGVKEPSGEDVTPETDLHVFYGVVSLSESSITPLVLTIPGMGDMIIPEAEQITPYMETDFQGLKDGDLIKITFGKDSDVQTQEANPGIFSEEAERIEVMGKGFLLFQRKDGTCYLGIPLGFVPDVKATDVFLNIYHSNADDAKEELLARTYIEYMDESENLLRFSLSDADTTIFLEEYGFGIRCVSMPLRQEELEDGIYHLIIRTLDQENRSIDKYIWSPSGTYLDEDNGAIPLKLSDNCRYTVNQGIVEPDFQEVSYEAFARIIENSDPWLNKPADMEIQNGAIISLTMDSEWYAYGISPISQDQENPYADMSERIRNEKLVDMLETYYTLVRTAEADVSDAPGVERLEIYRGNIGDGESGFLLVRGERNAVLHSRFLHQARAGRGSLYLCQAPDSGETLLVEVHRDDRDDYGEYRYCAYRLDARGVTKTKAGSSFEWGDSYIYREDLYEKWMSGMESYLEHGELLISCDEDGFNP